MPKEIIHESPIGKIEFKQVRNGFIKKDTNLVLIKLKKNYTSGITNRDASIEQIKIDMKNFYDKALKEKIQFIQIYDLMETELSTIYNDIVFVKDYGKFLESYAEPIIKECCKGTSIIVSSEIVKIIANTTLLLYRHVTPTKVHTSLIDAYEWLGNLEKSSFMFNSYSS